MFRNDWFRKEIFYYGEKNYIKIKEIKYSTSLTLFFYDMFWSYLYTGILQKLKNYINVFNMLIWKRRYWLNYFDFESEGKNLTKKFCTLIVWKKKPLEGWEYFSAKRTLQGLLSTQYLLLAFSRSTLFSVFTPLFSFQTDATTTKTEL